MKNKINQKYSPFIWMCLIIAYLFYNAYVIYLDFVGLGGERAATYVLTALYDFVEYGLLEAFICYLIASIVFSIGVRKYVRYLTRFDFTAQVMIVVGVIKLIFGVINIFSLLVPNIYYIDAIVEPIILTVVLLLYFFLVMCKKYNFNPVEKYNSYRVWFTTQLVLQGLQLLFTDGFYLILAKNDLSAYGITYTITEFQEILSIISICLYFAMIIAFVFINYTLKAKSEKYREQGTGARDIYKDGPFTVRIVDGDIKIEEKKDDDNKDDHHDDINDIFEL